MPKIKDPKRIFVKDIMRELMGFLKREGYDNQVIADVFNRHRSYVKRILEKRPRARSG